MDSFCSEEEKARMVDVATPVGELWSSSINSRLVVPNTKNTNTSIKEDK